MISKQTFQDDMIVCNVVREGDSSDCKTSGICKFIDFQWTTDRLGRKFRRQKLSSVGLNSVCGHSWPVGAEAQVCLEGGSN